MFKKILFFDTETTGFPSNGSLDSQPYIVQLAWSFGSYELPWDDCEWEHTFDELYHAVWWIPKQCSDIHWITDDMVRFKPQLHQAKFFTEFLNMMNMADYIVWHNIKYDMDMIAIHADRLSVNIPGKDPTEFMQRMYRKTICTMQHSIWICKIPGKFGQYKWPKLSEAHQVLFGCWFDNAHNALADITATKKIFFELVNREIIVIK